MSLWRKRYEHIQIVSLLGWINSDSKDFNFEGWCKVDKNKPSRYINLEIAHLLKGISFCILPWEVVALLQKKSSWVLQIMTLGYELMILSTLENGTWHHLLFLRAWIISSHNVSYSQCHMILISFLTDPTKQNFYVLF